MKKYLGMLFTPENNAVIAIGFHETSLMPDYYDVMQNAKSDFEARNGFNIRKPTIQLQFDENDFKSQE